MSKSKITKNLAKVDSGFDENQLKSPLDSTSDGDADSIKDLTSALADLDSTFDVDSTFDSDVAQNYIHIRVQQRNGRKTLTTLQGLPTEYNEKKLLKAFKKEFACNGTVVEDAEKGKVIQLQGDQRVKVHNFLTEGGISKDSIKLHGF